MLQRVTTAERSFVHIFFLDGVGLGGPDATANPFAAARLPNLTGLLGADWFLAERGPIIAPRASLIPTDATLGLPGRPQSATGQATILTALSLIHISTIVRWTFALPSRLTAHKGICYIA